MPPGYQYKEQAQLFCVFRVREVLILLGCLVPWKTLKQVLKSNCFGAVDL